MELSRQKSFSENVDRTLHALTCTRNILKLIGNPNQTEQTSYSSSEDYYATMWDYWDFEILQRSPLSNFTILLLAARSGASYWVISRVDELHRDDDAKNNSVWKIKVLLDPYHFRILHYRYFQSIFLLMNRIDYVPLEWSTVETACIKRRQVASLS